MPVRQKGRDRRDEHPSCKLQVVVVASCKLVVVLFEIWSVTVESQLKRWLGGGGGTSSTSRIHPVNHLDHSLTLQHRNGTPQLDSIIIKDGISRPRETAQQRPRATITRQRGGRQGRSARPTRNGGGFNSQLTGPLAYLFLYLFLARLLTGNRSVVEGTMFRPATIRRQRQASRLITDKSPSKGSHSQPLVVRTQSD